MKISIWRQFSSNHSSSFTVVGVFETPEAARHAVEQIQQILATIRQWHDDHPEEAESLYERWGSGDEDFQAPSEIELALGKQYGVVWQEGIEWFNDAIITTVLDHIVMLNTHFQTDSGPGPFAQIINRLGGRSMIAGMDIGGQLFGKITVTVICDAPNGRTALDIVQARSSEYDDRSVWCDGTRVNFDWDYYEVGWDVATIIDELKAQGCTNICYRFEGATFTRTQFYDFPPEEP